MTALIFSYDASLTIRYGAGKRVRKRTISPPDICLFVRIQVAILGRCLRYFMALGGILAVIRFPTLQKGIFIPMSLLLLPHGLSRGEAQTPFFLESTRICNRENLTLSSFWASRG